MSVPDQAEVFTAPDGRPALRVRDLALDGSGVEFVVVKSGMPVRWWAPDDQVPGLKWKPVLPAEDAARLADAEEKANKLAMENEALKHALATAVELVDDAGGERIRDTYRRWRPRTT